MLRKFVSAWRARRERRVRARREEEILRKCGCICYCPACQGILQDTHVDISEHDARVIYTCNCGAVSAWLFGTPVPILLKPKDNDEDNN